jgi:hypothetical protein
LVAGWTDISLSAKDIASAPYFIITYPELNSSYYITDFKAYTVSSAAEQVINLIDGLDFSDEYVMFHGNDITEARNAYNALSEKAKALVANYSKLQEIEALYANYVVVADMSSKTGFAAYEGMGNSSWISTGYDETYQNYLSVNIPNKVDANFALTFSSTNLSTKLEGCEKVYFYVYSPCTHKDRELLMKINGNYIPAGSRQLLTKQAWTKPEHGVPLRTPQATNPEYQAQTSHRSAWHSEQLGKQNPTKVRRSRSRRAFQYASAISLSSVRASGDCKSALDKRFFCILAHVEPSVHNFYRK